MASWGSQRQSLVLLVFFALLLGFASLVYFAYFKPVPTCSDGLQNQAELGIDCGGECTKVCESEVSPLITFWTRVFLVSDGEYDAAALIENSNAGYGIRNLTYTFKAYDRENVLVFEKRGTTFVNEKERFVIVEPRVKADNRTPVRAIVEFEEINWERLGSRERPNVTLENKILSLEPRPRLSAELLNESPKEWRDIVAGAVILDADNNAIGVSSTHVDVLPRGERASLVFTWPRAFDGIPVTHEIYPRINLVTP